MFKQTATPNIEVPPHYLQIARHWKMGSQSDDSIRQRLIQRGLSFEQSLKVIEILDQEAKHTEGGWMKGGYHNRLWVPIRGGSVTMGFAPGMKNAQASTWLVGYTGMLILGAMALLINRLITPSAVVCDIMGYTLMGMALMGLLIYGVTLVLGRFFKL